MYYLSRPINIWVIDPPQTVDIEIVTEDQKLSCVASIFEEENRCYLNPIDAANAAIKVRQQWIEKDKVKNVKIRVIVCSPSFIGEEVVIETKLTSKILNWANKEYKTIIKCRECSTILVKQNLNDLLFDKNYCSSKCSSKAIKEVSDSLNDNDESEFYI